MLKLGILASGRGSNFQAIADKIRSGFLPGVFVSVLISDQSDAPALKRAQEQGIPAVHICRKSFSTLKEYEQEIVLILQKFNVSLVVLAGYMRLVGKTLLCAFPSSVINIHPSLLPSFPGLHAQKQAIDHGVKISGCTVHFVDSGMDTGPIIMQRAVFVENEDNENTLSEKILSLEHMLLPEVIRFFSENRVKLENRKVRILPQEE